jgi:hypothetical protein
MSITPAERITEFIDAASELEHNKFYPDSLDGILHLGLEIAGGTQTMTMSMSNMDVDSLKSFLAAC